MTVLTFQRPDDSDDIFTNPDPVKAKEMRRLYRILRTYARTAHEQHFCDRCCRYIEPGDYYQGTVQLCNGKLMVWKEHEDPPCPVDPWEEEREMMEEIDKEIQAERQPKTHVA